MKDRLYPFYASSRAGACPMKTPRYRQLALAAALIFALPLNGQVWDGGGANGNTGTAANWVDDDLPDTTGADITFAGSTNTNVNNNYFTQLNSLTFASGAASFIISGDSLSPFPVGGNSIINSSTNLQTIDLDFTTAGGISSFVGVAGIAGSHTHISGDIGATGSVAFARTTGSSNPVFELSGNNSFRIARITSATLLFSSASAVPADQINPNNNAAAFDNTSGAAMHAAADIRIAGNGRFIGTDDFTTSGDFIVTYASGVRSFTIEASTLTASRISKQGDADGVFTKLGAGTLELAGAAALDVLGDFRIGAGTVRIGHQDALGYGKWILGNGTLAATANLSGANAVTNAVELAGTATLGGANNLTIAGTIADPASPDESDSITINTTAIIEFTGDNSYSGATFVNAGTLLINGDQSAATGDLSVASGAVLGGSGTIGGATTISGSLRPGNSIGTLTVANDVTWNSGQDWVFELGAANSADLLNISDGALFKGSGTTFQFDFDNSSETGVFTLINWTSEADLGGGALGTDFLLEDFSYTNLADGFSGTFAFDGTSLQFAVIPEPTAVALFVGILALLTVARRRR